ncbi:T9SS type A sorting domain-containing protein [Flavobacterium sp. NRK F10]|uniref:right-handed parallel beta-helix repeat-containing protein n=1 Tax=Flavobacterium sp. NRK F10 TaxID=2954931 RepID=UPI002091DEB1|nr:T9SS type A sorting domain-containing protein [Flavobacterium sp. NRK F10]MCO6176283.1 T9SS type A sorting domain-containing protein [Flavobacterium sp. NRK F10]
MKNIFSFMLVFLFSSITAFATDYYVAPNGNDSNSGTISSPFATLNQALSVVSPGDYIYLRGGIYTMASSPIVITTNGTSSANIHVYAYASEIPVLSFNDTESSSNRGIVLDGDYWHWKGITIEKAGDNGMLLSGNNNTIENCIFRKNHDTGLQLSRYSSSATTISQWPSNNLVLGCESYDNKDSTNENADGFAAKLTVGTGNIFRNCVSHHNIDDGWDLYSKTDTGAIGVVTIENCIAHHNGSLTDGVTSGGGDKNGYKLGSSAHQVNHIVRRCIAFQNGKHGFTDNGNIGSIEFTNNTSYDNDGYNWHTRDGATHIFKNNVSFENSTNDRLRGDTSAPNSFVGATGGFTVNSSDFVTLSMGSNAHPTSNGFLNLQSGSDLIDAGVTSSGITYNGSSPDLGAIESGASSGGGTAEIILTASAGNSLVNLNWTINNLTVTGLEVYRDTDSDPSGRTRIAQVSTSTRSYTDNSATAGTTYYYWIKANASINSNAASATPSGSSGGGTTSGNRIEDNDSRTISYDGSLKAYSNADNGNAINLANSAGKQIVWNYAPASSGTYQLTLRYTRKSTMNSSVFIAVNNGSNQTLTLPETSSSAFATVSMSVTLNSGTNVIQLTTNSDGESADIDWIEFGSSTSKFDDTKTVKESVSLVSLYPNPSQSVLNIEIPETKNYNSLSIVNMSGVEVLKRNNITTHNTINIDSLAKGTYILKLASESTSETKIFIKE